MSCTDGRTPPLLTLKKRREFLRLRGGARWGTPAFVLETKPREESSSSGARFGFTVTKALGNAVNRNRIRRRLKALVRAGGIDLADPSHDYVLIARPAALDRPFADLANDLAQALRRVHHHSPGRAPNMT